MRRRAKATKAQGRKPLKRRRKASKGKTDRRFLAEGREANIARLTRERDELLQQRAATSEVLRAISSWAGDLEPVFQAVLENAVRICDAKFGTLFRFDGASFHFAASVGTPAKLADFERQRGPFQPPLGTLVERVRQTKRVQHTADYSAEPVPGASARLGGARSAVCIPMLKGDSLVGVFLIYRQEVRPFTDRQIELLKNFAAQAVIAIENTRLLNELRESLQQQTATADVLQVISSSPGALGAVFDSILKNATNICQAGFGQMFLFDRGNVQVVAQLNVPAPLVEWDDKQGCHPPVPGGPMEHIIRNKKVVHIPDVSVEHRDHPVATLGGAKTQLGVPMVKEDRLIGALNIYRQEVRPFTDKQIELVKNFAAQAVIAIENARLLSELRESLQQQTATADVLKIISRSTFDLGRVLNTLAESATRLCEADGTMVWRPNQEGRYQLAASFGLSPEFETNMNQISLKADGQSMVGRALQAKKTFHVPDMNADPEYAAYDLKRMGGYRAVLGVPLMREGVPIGVMMVGRQTPKAFTEGQIALVTTFADQAVIAIENVRLFDEVQARTRELSESLQQQTATADVLKVISRSTFDLQTVLDSLVEMAARVCEADTGIIRRREGDTYPVASTYGFSGEQRDRFTQYPAMPDRSSVFGRAILEGRTIHVPDLLSDPDIDQRRLRDYAGVVNIRSGLGVLLMREGAIVGVFTLQRRDPRPFTEKQIELVETFANQAVIAIENVRLFESVEARTRELAKSLEDLRTTQDRLVQTQKLALLGQLTAGIAHEIKNPLNFVNNFSGISAELIDELQDTLKGMPLDDKARADINELTGMLKSNFDKVVHHGRRADAIVKNMLQHSREGTGEHRTIDINALVEESLNLAWHGARAETQGFEIKLKQSFDPSAGEADIFPQDIRRALLNMISNGFYAANRRRAETNGGDYEPTLVASTKNLGDRVEIKIRDNGTGMPPDVKEKMFNPFFTTKPTGEGTGLGLSISHDIIVKQHGGSIEVDTQPGEFTEIRVILPRAAVLLPGGS
ncbi:MAG TPA: GAF domain-containing protein [Pseudolabrys sp.]|nr:GAF domain-containing protein [Pseudolabrys sp.]